MSAQRPLSGRVVAVTGGGTGIGAACCLAFARAGADVCVIFNSSADEAAATAAACEACGVRALAVKADCSVDAAVTAALGAAAAALGGLDFLVVSAGTTRFVPLADLDAVTDADWEAILGLNVRGAFYAARAAAPLMRARGGGLMVNIASVAGLTGGGSSIPYAASKGAMLTLTKSLAKALAPAIRVNAVAPGIVTTRWVAGKEEFVEKYGADTPLGRVASAEDVAGVVLSFATTSTFLTGACIVCDGGREMR